MDISLYFTKFIIGILAATGYGVTINAPKKTLLAGALNGALSYLVYFYLLDYQSNVILAAFAGALTIGVIGEVFSRRFHAPATVFILPGLITLVPGGGIYYTMLYLIEGNREMFYNKGIETFFIAASLSIGILASTIFSKSLQNFKKAPKPDRAFIFKRKKK